MLGSVSFTEIYRRHQRQVHLDFHTSPHIPDVGCEFDARAFATTMKKAHVNSVTIFAKCHHGMCYYPTKTGTQHPALHGRDLLGEQLEALHREGIRAPIYTTIVWEEDVARRFPEWRQLTREGYFAGFPVGPDGKPGNVATWQFNNFLDLRYQDYIEAHVREILSLYGKDVDGFFFDILFFAPDACWSDASRVFRQKHSLWGTDRATFEIFQGLAQAEFAEKFTKIVHGIRPQATIFYNSPNEGNMDPRIGPRAREAFQTHFEIESLPSGFWGYHHLPRMARAQSTWGKPWLGMTGRFQKMWGDFGGIKPQAALEFECFRSQALGGANSIGDQLPPRGTLDAAAYKLIGAVYEKCAEAEPFYEGSEFIKPRLAIFSASYPGHDGGKSEEGAVLLCEEAHYDCAVIDGKDPLDGYNLLILPDTTPVDSDLASRLMSFLAGGGKLLFSYRSGFSTEGVWKLDDLPLKIGALTELYPTYWRARESMRESLTASDRVFYEAGLEITALKDCEILIDRVPPYFRRTAATFSSHSQTPPVAQVGKYPAAVSGPGFVYFADPIFREYRQTANLAVRQAWQKVVFDLIGPAPYGLGLPSTVMVYPRRRGDTLLLTLLHYVPVRKCIDIDVIDEPSTFSGEVLRIAGNPALARLWPDGRILNRREDGTFELPSSKGRLLIEIPDYFS